jgi:hypothetical protein
VTCVFRFIFLRDILQFWNGSCLGITTERYNKHCYWFISVDVLWPLLWVAQQEFIVWIITGWNLFLLIKLLEALSLQFFFIKDGAPALFVVHRSYWLADPPSDGKTDLPSESGIEVAIFVPRESSKICSPLHFSVFQFGETKNKTKDYWKFPGNNKYRELVLSLWSKVVVHPTLTVFCDFF